MSANQVDPKSRSKTNATFRLSNALNRMDHDNSSSSVAEMLARVLKVEDSDQNRAQLLALSKLTKMIEDSQREVQSYLADEWNFYSVHFTGIRACFNVRTSGQPWNAHKKNLTSSDLTGIRHTAQSLLRLSPEIALIEPDKKAILDAIEEMSLALDNQELSKYSRNVLRQRLEAIRAAVEDYGFSGASGADECHRAFLGTFLTDPIVRDDVRKDCDRGGKLWETIKEKAGVIALCLSVLNGIHDVAHNFLPTFESLIQHSLPNPQSSLDLSAPSAHPSPTTSSETRKI